MDERDPGYDDWFDEPAPPSREAGRGGRDVVYDDADDVWVIPEDEERGARRSAASGEIVVAGRVLTTTQFAIIIAAVLAVFFGILAAAGVFSSSPKSSAPPITTITTLTQPTTSASQVTTPAATAPTSTLKPGDTGAQVKVLQGALNALGFSVGKPDGFYGPTTQSAVEQFQSSKKLAADGVVGPATLNALSQSLSG
ncbi:MAG: peptidoglycan-binding domain-containing protein [Gaiellaceae bacterium]